MMEETFYEEGMGKQKQNTVAIKIALVLCLVDLYEQMSLWTWTLASSDKKFIYIIISYLCLIVTWFHISRCPIHYGLVF